METMHRFLTQLIAGYVFLMLAGTAPIKAAPSPGSLEGHLKIVSPKEVELADATPFKGEAQNYADYPLIILSRDRKQEIARLMADENGNYRVALPPGEYVLDVQGRRPGGVRAKPQPFTVVSNQTAHVDMNIDTGVR
jgi:hypothetical protein